jgi:DNA/RNA-binding domain of Phe-tRNA-synthetase-like protein
LEKLIYLGDRIHWIQGIHINGTDFFDYLKKSHHEKYNEYLKAEEQDKFMMIYQHISSMDQHIPLKSKRVNEIIDLVKPKYEMIELVGRDKESWEGFVIEQLKVLVVL